MKRQMIGLLRLASAGFFLAFSSAALAQNPGTVTNHAFPIGKGAGVQGFGSLLLGSGQIAIGQTSADPSAVTPTGDVTIMAAGVTAIGANKVANTQLRQSGALALIGRSANSTGNVADILATAGSSCVFLESSSTLTCATITAANIAANAVTNAKLATMGAYTFKCNNSGSTAVPTDCDATAFTSKASPVSGDIIVIQDSAASNAYKKTTIGAIATAGSVSSLNGQTGALVSYFAPQGRLTLASGVPVMTASQSGKTTVLYTPYIGNMVPIYDGTNIIPTVFAEVSQTTTDTTKSPAAVAASSAYDIFCWVDSGTNRCTRGPVWTDTKTRSAGSALVLVNGIYLNSVSITNGPAASRGTWVGIIVSNSSSQIDFIYGGNGVGGVAAVFNLWNAYNRALTKTFISDSTDSWTYAVASTIRAANGSSTMRVTYVSGLAQDPFSATYAGMASLTINTNFGSIGVGYDSTSSFCGTIPYMNYTGIGAVSGTCSQTSLGQHFFSANEYRDGGTVTFFGDVGLPGFAQSGLNFEGWF